MGVLRRIFAYVLCCFVGATIPSLSVYAQAYKNEIGFTQLQAELAAEGKAVPNGAGVVVGLVEANTSGSATLHAYRVNTAGSEFAGKNVIDLSNITPNQNSNHATTVAGYLAGNQQSLSAGVTTIHLYYASDFLGAKQGLGTANNPAVVTADILNHSFVANFTNPPNIPAAIESNARLDFTVQRDQFTNVVALNNGTGALPHIYGQSYNSIVVGLSNGNHSRGQTTIGVVGRTKPDIVAPGSLRFTSYATPVVSTTAALLHSAASSFGYNDARAPEAMKAIIMAGADKTAVPAWSNTSTRPLDSVYGAGQVDVYNSYRILEAGQFDGSTTFTVGNSGLKGWDYGEISASQDLFWNFDTQGVIETASILVTWNADYSDANGNFSVSDFRLANMRLSLHSYNGNTLGDELFFSDSLVDNVEHLYLKNLNAGRYTLRLSSNLDSRFGMAWGITAVPEPSTFVLLGSIAGFALLRRRFSRKVARTLSSSQLSGCHLLDDESAA
ncbi:MAG: S8 family serine peptidase [Pirellula sp.]|jgi:hypothetical protein|nr:S8 family serine peptidase [Pirellula sp.]